MKPSHKHDCTACRFLGTYEAHDLYFCKKENWQLSSIIARFGSLGPDYLSVPICVPPPSMRDCLEMNDSASMAALRVAYIIVQDTLGEAR